MILQLELTRDEEVALARKAEAQGMDVAKYTRLLLGLDAWSTIRLPVDDWEAALDELAVDVDPGTPALSDEVLSRRSIYGDRA